MQVISASAGHAVQIEILNNRAAFSGIWQLWLGYWYFEVSPTGFDQTNPLPD